MTATTRQWLCHFEYPHTWRDLRTESTGVVHDRRFGITLLFIGLAALIGAVVLLGILSSGNSAPIMEPNYWYYWPANMV